MAFLKRIALELQAPLLRASRLSLLRIVFRLKRFERLKRLFMKRFGFVQCLPLFSERLFERRSRELQV